MQQKQKKFVYILLVHILYYKVHIFLLSFESNNIFLITACHEKSEQTKVPSFSFFVFTLLACPGTGV